MHSMIMDDHCCTMTIAIAKSLRFPSLIRAPLLFVHLVQLLVPPPPMLLAIGGYEAVLRCGLSLMRVM